MLSRTDQEPRTAYLRRTLKNLNKILPPSPRNVFVDCYYGRKLRGWSPVLCGVIGCSALIWSQTHRGDPSVHRFRETGYWQARNINRTRVLCTLQQVAVIKLPWWNASYVSCRIVYGISYRVLIRGSSSATIVHILESFVFLLIALMLLWLSRPPADPSFWWSICTQFKSKRSPRDWTLGKRKKKNRSFERLASILTPSPSFQ